MSGSSSLLWLAGGSWCWFWRCFWLSLRLGAADDLADQGVECGRGGGDFEGFAEHGCGFGEERFVLRVQGDERLAFGDSVA